MKKNIILVLITLLIIFSPVAFANEKDTELLNYVKQSGYNVNINAIPKSAIVIDAQTGNIFWEKNADLSRDPASISKLMTIYLVYEAMEKGELSLETKILATKKDEQISKIHELSNSKIINGVEYPVEELIKMTVVPSSNVATIMLANYLSNNDVDLFIDKMNEKAKELGMKNTYFNTASGAVAVAFQGYYSPKKYDINSYDTTTARDLSILTYNLLKKYPNLLEYTKFAKITTMQGTPYEETFKNHNHSLAGLTFHLEGVDGLKTGSSPNASFNISATAKRDNFRLISIIMGVGKWENRNSELYRHTFLNALLEYGFNNYERKVVLSKGKHTINDKKIILEQDYIETVPKGLNKNDYQFEMENNVLKLKTNLENINKETINNGVSFKELTLIEKLTDFLLELDTKNKILFLSLITLSSFIIILLAIKIFK